MIRRLILFALAFAAAAPTALVVVPAAAAGSVHETTTAAIAAVVTIRAVEREFFILLDSITLRIERGVHGRAVVCSTLRISGTILR